MESQIKLKKWGNSLGVIIPIEAIREQGFKEGEEVIIDIRRKKSMKHLFGSLKSLNIDSQKMKDELRKDWNK